MSLIMVHSSSKAQQSYEITFKFLRSGFLGASAPKFTKISPINMSDFSSRPKNYSLRNQGKRLKYTHFAMLKKEGKRLLDRRKTGSAPKSKGFFPDHHNLPPSSMVIHTYKLTNNKNITSLAPELDDHCDPRCPITESSCKCTAVFATCLPHPTTTC